MENEEKIVDDLEITNDEDISNNEDISNDDSWIDDLEPYKSEPATAQQEEQNTEPPKATNLDDTSLRAKYENLTYTDADVAYEVKKQILDPEMNAIRQELATLKKTQEDAIKKSQSDILASANKVILSRYPQAEKILQSKNFIDFVNSTNNRYSADTNFNMLIKAYYAGDTDYVLERLDAFAQTRGKPTAPVGAEKVGGNQGGSGIGSGKRPMTDAEYRAKRKKILSAPRGTYKTNALKDLSNEYLTSNRG